MRATIGLYAILAALLICALMIARRYRIKQWYRRWFIKDAPSDLCRRGTREAEVLHKSDWRRHS